MRTLQVLNLIQSSLQSDIIPVKSSLVVQVKLGVTGALGRPCSRKFSQTGLVRTLVSAPAFLVVDVCTSEALELDLRNLLKD